MEKHPRDGAIAFSDLKASLAGMNFARSLGLSLSADRNLDFAVFKLNPLLFSNFCIILQAANFVCTHVHAHKVYAGRKTKNNIKN